MTFEGLAPAMSGNQPMQQVRAGLKAIKKQYPDKMLAYNCSPSFNGKAKLDKDMTARFQREVGTGYFGLVAQAVAGDEPSATALGESTGAAPFTKEAA